MKKSFFVYANIISAKQTPNRFNGEKKGISMKKNLIIIALIFALPLIAYWMLTSSNSTTAKTIETGKPQVIKFTSAMCLDCQTMNKIFKEIFPKYEGKIVLTEMQVQDNNSFN